MNARIAASMQRRFFEELVGGQNDLLQLANKINATPQALALWIGEDANQRLLRLICLLADMQTQLQINRYRALAACRLAQLTQQDDAELARKACVDLLKLDLRSEQNIEPNTEQNTLTQPTSLRDLLYDSIHNAPKEP